jgi:polyhydroxybutyrate depolymerase
MFNSFMSLLRLRHLLVLSLLTLLASCAPASQGIGLSPGRYVEKIPEPDQNRSFILDIPRSYDPKKPIAVVVVLHGWTATAAMAEKYTGMQIEGETQGFVTVFPDGVGKGWNAGFINLTGLKDNHPDDVKFIDDLLDHLEKEINVDKNREYVCGHSNGAFMANYLGAKLSSRLAAIGSVAGSTGTKTKRIPDPDSPISVILIHGKQDPMVAYAVGDKALFQGVGAEDAAAWWAQKDGCGPAPSTNTSANGNVTTELFSGGKGDSEVELVTIANGSHSWPGGLELDKNNNPVKETATGVNAADLIWQFFKSHPKTGAIH